MATHTTYCLCCHALDSRWLPLGESLKSLTCVECGDMLVTHRHRMARICFFAYLGQRCVAVVRRAVAGELYIEEAVRMVMFTAHEAFAAGLIRREPL